MQTNNPDMSHLDPRRRRIYYRAVHRGTHETDVLIGGFVAPRLATMTDAELDALEEVMELPDADLADWLSGRRPIPPEVDTPMMRAILADANDPARLAAIRGPK
ncbi:MULTISPECIES: FAD assembly factor SdhE [Novacetimonas]|uniref:FAD assembly factor SdhE n=2 Tax=Novacetimonas TaxID=2919364 RepID=A0A318Q756_9PROT|nr:MULTISPECIES: succinate dehydrogenase assembly factor 2 [Novacetimonas]MBV1832489.1 succinate dehydrogenase assembly factor 2 [Novacetimonas pomaceti]PYD47981.1 succinate dehydrogenase assembly factor 2 [Novacetimonas pomaceti]PYD75486.1 succinate dehydrogenase assembly factor 2 [Novacetimonas pomaceti]RBM08753.1 succinate dehydrogenase assembly factor 2 [Novacetimonas cocois]